MWVDLSCFQDAGLNASITVTMDWGHEASCSRLWPGLSHSFWLMSEMEPYWATLAGVYAQSSSLFSQAEGKRRGSLDAPLPFPGHLVTTRVEGVPLVIPRGGHHKERPGQQGQETVETSLLMNVPRPLIWALPLLIPQQCRHMLFLLELKSFVDTEIRFSCARHPHLYTLTHLCSNFWQSALLFSLCHVWLSVTPWTAACQASLSSCLPEFAQVHVHFLLTQLLPVFSPKQRGPQGSFRSSQNNLRGLQ